jgi:hypothetical protein
MQIHKHKDYRVNELAELIENLQDNKYHIKPFEMATEIVIFMDNLRGKEYARKIQDHVRSDFKFQSKNKV